MYHLQRRDPLACPAFLTFSAALLFILLTDLPTGNFKKPLKRFKDGVYFSVRADELKMVLVTIFMSFLSVSPSSGGLWCLRVSSFLCTALLSDRWLSPLTALLASQSSLPNNRGQSGGHTWGANNTGSYIHELIQPPNTPEPLHHPPTCLLCHCCYKSYKSLLSVCTCVSVCVIYFLRW